MAGAHVVFYVLAGVGWRRRHDPSPPRAFYVPFYFTLVNAAALTATARFVLGRRQSIWEKAESTRRELPAATVIVPARDADVAPELVER